MAALGSIYYEHESCRTKGWLHELHRKCGRSTSSLATTCPRRFFRRSFIRIRAIFGAALGVDGPAWRIRWVKSFWTHTDSDRTQFNYSEILGNSTAVAISNTYYEANRSVADSASTLGIQIGVDMASNVLKEFWPDVSRKFRHRQPELH